jgi:hypothetical protein
VIPVLGIPCISRPDLLAELAETIDHPVAEVVIVDNSPDGLGEVPFPDCVARVTWLRPLDNLGFAGSVNAVLRGRPSLPWWAFANADATCGFGDLARLEREMDPEPERARIARVHNDYRLFAVNRALVDAVGLWDENFHPVYCEDSDYGRRMDLAGVDQVPVWGSAGHFGSATIADPFYAAHNARTYPLNRDYYVRKWGGWLGGEAFTTPFGRGGSVRDWTLEHARLREQGWG